jgi:hypothetical protein
MFHTTRAGLLALDPTLRVVGLSATCFRLDSGLLTEGDGKLFDDTVYRYSLGDAIRDGWLAPLVAKGTAASIDVSGVHIRAGEFVPGELEHAATRGDLISRTVDEIIRHGAARRAWLIFCITVAHVELVAGCRAGYTSRWQGGERGRRTARRIACCSTLPATFAGTARWTALTHKHKIGRWSGNARSAPASSRSQSLPAPTAVTCGRCTREMADRARSPIPIAPTMPLR